MLRTAAPLPLVLVLVLAACKASPPPPPAPPPPVQVVHIDDDQLRELVVARMGAALAAPSGDTNANSALELGLYVVDTAPEVAGGGIPFADAGPDAGCMVWTPPPGKYPKGIALSGATCAAAGWSSFTGNLQGKNNQAGTTGQVFQRQCYADLPLRLASICQPDGGTNITVDY
jgi:hypothetical protein